MSSRVAHAFWQPCLSHADARTDASARARDALATPLRPRAQTGTRARGEAFRCTAFALLDLEGAFCQNVCGEDLGEGEMGKGGSNADLYALVRGHWSNASRMLLSLTVQEYCSFHLQMGMSKVNLLDEENQKPATETGTSSASHPMSCQIGCRIDCEPSSSGTIRLILHFKLGSPSTHGLACDLN